MSGEAAGGWYAMARGWMDHPVFADEPFTEREAWEWLIGNAAWKAQTVNRSGFMVPLRRGELCHSVRHLADRWGWQKSRVDRFLGKLAGQQMIDRLAKTGTAAGHGVTVITVCNYDEYQKAISGEGLASGTAAGQRRDSKRDDIEQDSNKITTLSEGTSRSESLSENSENTLFDSVEVRSVDSAFEVWWGFTPRKVAKGGALKAYRAARKKVSEQILLAGIKAFAARCVDKDPQFIAHPATWLNQTRWADEQIPDTNVVKLDPVKAREERIARWQAKYGSPESGKEEAAHG